MDHASRETHVAVRDRVLRDMTENGKFIEREARQRLVVRPLVNPAIVWQQSQKPGMKPVDELQPDGVWLIPNPSVNQHHLVWNIDQCQIIPAASFNPDTDYQNGIQELTADGWVQGHLHMKGYAAKDSQQVQDHEAGKDVPYPASFYFRGGPRWYTSRKMPNGSWNIMAETLTGIVFDPALVYVVELSVVHIDDTEVNTVLHGQSRGLTTLFRVRA